MTSSSTAAETPATSWVLDASALLALLLREPGAERVRQVIAGGASMSSVNVSEVVARLMDLDYSREEVDASFQGLRIDIIEFDVAQARDAGYLRPLTRSRGLSLGDRACLAVARRLGLPALTADRNWAGLDAGVEVVICR